MEAIATDTSETDEMGGGQVKTLVKGLAVLEMIMAETSVRTTDVADRFSIDKGTASRILHTLASCGFAEKTSGRRYVAGHKMHVAMARPRSSATIRVRARPLLEAVAERTGESAHLGIMADNQVLYLDRVDSESALRVERPIGTLAPIYCTALGKLFLAYNQVPIPAEMPAITIRTETDPDALKAHLRKVVAQGYATDDEEFSLGIRCVAAPLRDSRGTVIAALGLSGPTPRIDLNRMLALGELVREVAGRFDVE